MAGRFRVSSLLWSGFSVPLAALLLAFCLPLPRAVAANGTADISDPVPLLLEGPRVVTDVNRLAKGARRVQGLAADGVSRVLLAIHAASAGEPVQITVFNDQDAPSSSTAEDGALAAVGSGQFDTGQLTVSAVATSSRGPMAFAIYRAPLDFARPGGADDKRVSRSVSLHWSSGGTAQGKVALTILRPPLVLVHGLWGSPDDWDDFQPLAGSNPIINEYRFQAWRADYSFTVGGIVSSEPAWAWTDVAALRANDLGFDYNARQVMQQIDSFVQAFKRRANPASIPVAAVKADVVAHSMGGDIVRTMALVPGFASDATFAQGNVHKLITVDTPHLGSPLASNILKSNNTCLRDKFNFAGMYAFQSVTTAARQTIDGAMGDLSGDGAGGAMSEALEALQPSSNIPLQVPHGIPTAYLAGAMSAEQLDGLDDPGYFIRLIRAWCKGDPLADDLTVSGWPQMMGGPSDAIVPLASEKNASPAYREVAAVHSDGTEYLGFKGPGALDAVTGNPQSVIDLLNTWIADPVFTRLR